MGNLPMSLQVWLSLGGGGGEVFTTCDQSLLTWGERMSLQTI